MHWSWSFLSNLLLALTLRRHPGLNRHESIDGLDIACYRHRFPKCDCGARAFQIAQRNRLRDKFILKPFFTILFFFNITTRTICGGICGSVIFFYHRAHGVVLSTL